MTIRKGIYYETIGIGEPVIYLPGTGWAGNQGLHLAEILADAYQVYMLDLPGIGRSEGIQGRIDFGSMAEWLKGFMDEAGLEAAVLIGHSLGGAIALSFARKYPERVSRLVLLDIGHMKMGRFPTRMFGPMGWFVPLISLYERVIGPGRDKESVARYTERSPEKIDEVLQNKIQKTGYGLTDDRYMRDALAVEPEAINSGLNLLLVLYRTRLPEELAAVEVKTLLVYGTHKGTARERQIDRAVQKFHKHENLRLIPVESEHYPHWANDAVSMDISDFLKCGIQAGGSARHK